LRKTVAARFFMLGERPNFTNSARFLAFLKFLKIFSKRRSKFTNLEKFENILAEVFLIYISGKDFNV